MKFLEYVKDLKSLAIITFIGVIIISQFYGCEPSWPWNKKVADTISVKVDTVYKKVKEEVPVYIPKWRTKIKTDTVVKFKNIDTAAVVAEYYSKYKYEDTLTLSYTDRLGIRHPFGYGVVTDVVSKNRIMQRGINWNYKLPSVTKTITIKEPPKRQLYAGIGTEFNRLNFIDNVSAGLVYKTKRDRLYQISIGMSNQGGVIGPFIGGGIYWKIKLKN
jgi:hypothetical protein